MFAANLKQEQGRKCGAEKWQTGIRRQQIIFLPHIFLPSFVDPWVRLRDVQKKHYRYHTSFGFIANGVPTASSSNPDAAFPIVG
jgi:hypothetical protein